MLNLTKRVNKLLEKSTSLETKTVCKEVMEMYTTVPEEQLAQSLIEKLRGVKDSDKYVSSFVHVAEKYLGLRDLGIAKAISNIRESQSYHYQALRYSLDKFERAKITEGTQDYLMVEDFLSSLKDFTWDKNVNDSLEAIKEKFEANKENVIVSKALYEFRRAKGNFLYEALCEMLEDHFENPTQASRSAIIESLQKFLYSPVAKKLSENLTKIQALSGKSLQIIAENGACTVNPVYSTIIMENGKEYFSVKGDVYRKAASVIEKVTPEEFGSLSENVQRSYHIFNSPYFFVKEGKASFYLGKNKIEIFESAAGKQVSFNGKPIPGNDIAKNLVSTGMLRLEEAKVASDIQFVNDIFENFYELDFAKVITSKLYEGSYVTLMKENDKIYLNKVNTSMKTNEFFSDLNATQLRNLILEFIGYDIKESMVEFIENDEREMQAIREEQTEVLKNLTIVEGEIFKVESAKQDAYLASTPQIKTLEETLRRELINLKAQYTALSEKLKKFASKPSDSGVEVGQDVRLTESGARATVSSIDSNTKTVKVVTSEGATLEIEHGKYEALEEEKEVAANKNDNKSETEGDKVDAEKRPEELEVDEKLSIKQKTLPQGLQDAILKKQGEKPEKEEKVEETHAIAGGNDEMPVENPNKDDFPQQEPEGESTEAPEEAPEEESEYVKAKVDDEQGGSCAGQEVEILATDYTTKGDEDLIQVKCGDEIFFIEKKFLEISTTEADDSLTIDFDAEAPGEKKKDDEEEDDDSTESPSEEPISAAEKPAEEPASEEPAPEAPAEEAPAEEPASEEPAPEAPAEEPASEEPAPEAPAEAPAEEAPAEEPASEEPAPEAPASEEPAEEPASEEPAPEAPASEEPAEEPASEEPAPEAPASEPEKAPEDRSEDDEEANREHSSLKTINSLHKKLKRALEDLEEIKADMKDTFTSNETISTTINGLKGLVEALDKDAISESKR